MSTVEIAKGITDYFENTILFLPNLTSAGLGEPLQLRKTLRLDIVNEKPDGDDCKSYEVESLEKISDVIASIFQKSREEVMSMVGDFVKQETVDITKPMYLVAYLIEDKS